MPRPKVEILKPLELQTPVFSSGAVCAVLGTEAPLLPSVLEYRHPGSKERVFKPSKQIGSGRGGRKYFRVEQVYRIVIAARLAADGFAPRFIVKVLDSIDDADFIDFDEHGPVRALPLAFKRSKGEPQFETVSRRNPPRVGLGTDVYYLLDLAAIVDDVDERIRKLKIEQSPTGQGNREARKRPKKSVR